MLPSTDPYTPVGGVSRAGAGGSLETSRLAGDDQAPTLDQPLTLEECIDLSLANNPRLARANWDAMAADAQRDVAAGQRWATLGTQGEYRRSLDDQRLVAARSPGEPGSWSSDTFSADLTLSMPLFTGGRITNEIAAARLSAEAAVNRLVRTRTELVFNVSRVFYSILGQRQVIESLEFSRKALEEHRQRVQDLLDVQKAARVDLLRTEVRLADIEQKLVSERNTLNVQHRVLANLLGIDENSDAIEIAGELVLSGFEAADAPVAFAYEQRDDYRAADAELKEQARRVDAARADNWPTVSLIGSYGGRWAEGGVNSQSGADSTEDVGSIGVVVEMPIFEGGRINARIRRERAKLASTQERLRELELQIREEVRTALLNVQSSRERVRATEKAIERGRESLRIEREKYDLGKGTITDVLDAQSALLESETNHAQALAAYNTAIAQYHGAVGKN